MTIHVFPSGREIDELRLSDRAALRPRGTRVELWLVAGLIAATVVQAALFACVWLD